MKSLWIETTKDEISLEPLRKDEETEVCVIGAGLFGLTTAYYLTELGKKVIVLEKGEIGEKASGNTTGKISSLHGLFYDHLISDYGEDYASKGKEYRLIYYDIKNRKEYTDEPNPINLEVSSMEKIYGYRPYSCDKTIGLNKDGLKETECY